MRKCLSFSYNLLRTYVRTFSKSNYFVLFWSEVSCQIYKMVELEGEK